MIALARAVVMTTLILTIFYLALWLHLRTVQVERLGAEWEANPVGERGAHIRRGLAERAGPLHRRLVLAVYVLPIALMILVIALTNA